MSAASPGLSSKKEGCPLANSLGAGTNDELGVQRGAGAAT